MFTGLIEDVGRVSACEQDGGGIALAVETRLAGELGLGDSIAVNGVCLTATAVSEGGFEAHAMAETLRRTSLAGIVVGTRVNLELPLRIGDRLGGHLVQGHVDGTGEVTELRDEGGSRTLTIALDPEMTALLAPKGSVTLDGVSLTVSALEAARFSVSLIPETLTRTTLGELTSGETVNVELDVLAKHIQRLIASNLVPR
ncbi:MAG TPA: riboflavin synthase [Solirubrobacteraceae bacterium]